MRSTGIRAESRLPSYLAGAMIVRGRTRWILTVALLAVFVLVALPLQDAIGYWTGAPSALFAFVLAWIWGRWVGVIAAVFAWLLNYSWGGIPRADGWVGTAAVVDGVAIAVVAFFVGHVSQSLERALGARHRTAQAYSELEQAHQQRMLTITDLVPVGLYRTTAAGQVIGGNDALIQILGFADRESLLRTNVWDHYVRAEDRLRQIDSAGAADDTWHEYQLRRADGEIIWVRDWATAVRDADGRVEHFDGVLEDITAQRQADARFRAAFEDAPIAMSIGGPDGRIIRANAATADMLGVTLDEVEGLHFSDYSFEDELEMTETALQKLHGGEVVRYEKRVRRTDGSTVWVLVSLAPIDDGSAESASFVSHVIDVTDRRKAREALEDLVRSKDELIASVSHELRTPLTVIHGLAEELDSGWVGFTVPEQKEFIGMIAQQSAEVAYIVEDLLVAARADIGKLPIKPDHVNLLSQLDSAVIEAQSDELPAHVVGEATPVAFADGTRVRQIIRNLISNARRYGGEEITASCGVTDHVAWLEIADNGEGIPEDDAAAVFEPYHRSHNAAGQPLSVGLGLTVSRKLARLMGGDLTYRYSQGQAVFRLELPAVGAVHSAGTGTAGAAR
ncbi:MAG: PAS domain S-box protein [Acidimicrobiia bacterium]|nr:PAS domain S-box protein [Acidimicrobiia bacterium]